MINPKIFLSLHVNWSKNNNRRGPVIIYQVSGESYHLAQIIQDHLNNYYGMKKSIRKGDPYFLMKKLDMPSIIVELGYISNGNDFKILTEEETQDELVSAIVEAIEEYFLLYPVENEEKTK
ncbi:MAG: N-acetylmuramoyl-L-alanine amidase [Bacillaceae bacterium]|nr:N-acetylmuramoyl-L-alanine amidase [Bacillaceae bacterium]